MSTPPPLDVRESPPSEGRAPAAVVRDPRFSRAQRSWALMIVAGLLAGFANLVVLRADAPRTQIVTVVGDHPAGTALAELPTAVEEVEVPDPMALRLMTPAVLVEMAGTVTAVALDDGEVLRLGDLRSASADGRSAMSMPLPSGRAVAGAVEPGDQVDVVADLGAGVEVVAAGLEVIDVSRSETSLGGGDTLVVTVAVTDEDVLPLAAALRADALDLVRRSGRGSVADDRADG